MVCWRLTPQKNKDLKFPLNILEKEKDKEKIWRNYVNNQLKTNYKNIFQLIDKYYFFKGSEF